MRTAAAAGAAILILVLGGCGKGGDERGQTPERLGDPEGALDLVVPPGYLGRTAGGPPIDLVGAFERRTGCRVSDTQAESPGKVTALVGSGRYDGVLARGDAGRGLIEHGHVDPINTDLIPNYADVFPQLKDLPHDTVDGVHYGIPQGRSANLLIWVPAVVERDRDEFVSSDLIFDPELAARYAGRVTIMDDPLYIAEAAIYLREHEPELGIENVFELDEEQFDAAIELLKEQRAFVGRYSSGPSDNARAFASGAAVAGTGSLLTTSELRGRGVKVDAAMPKEGATGASDTWMINSRARHPNCMYLWMDFVLGPEANAAVAVRTGQAPANERACNLIGAHCDEFRAADEELFDDVEYTTTPLRDCGDDRGEACRTYDEWARAFAEVRGMGR
jgi:putative spermidine/putrescine transport system substrate-binding protein